MTIACLGWGSLTWDPRELPIAGKWEDDGPPLPLEFARESADGRMTLVIVEHDTPVITRWVPLAVKTLDEAIDALAAREGVARKASIGRWPSMGSRNAHDAAIGAWAEGKRLSGVVWTALKPGFRDVRGPTPSLEEIVRHMEGLSPTAWREAERYVRLAPAQIATPYRMALEDVFARGVL